MKSKNLKTGLAYTAFSVLVFLTVGCSGTPDGTGGTIYYVDSIAGNDFNNGTSPDTAWRSLVKVNNVIFKPGSKILFKAGTVYGGCLEPKGSGKEGRPIIVDMYGSGDIPRIDAGGRCNQALLLKNQQYWEINNLELTNLGPERKRFRYGVRITVMNYGTMRHIRLNNLYIHDVNGTLQKEDRAEGHGIFYCNTGLVPSRFDGLVIENCRIEHVDRNGIGGNTLYRTYRDIKNTNVVIRRNTLFDIGGDGIKVSGCDGALVEYNLVREGSRRHEGFSCGIWPFSTTNSVFQYNEVCFMKSTRDGQAFDSDNDCRNNVFQYNYSHDNEGGFFLVCTRYLSKDNIGNNDTIIRYNISQNDKARSFLIGGPVAGLRIYNNIIYIDEDLDVKLVHFAPRLDAKNEKVLWGTDIAFFNNIVISKGMARVTYNRSPMNPDGTYEGIAGTGYGDIDFRTNVFYGNFNYPFWGTGKNLTVDPGLASPGTGGFGFDTLDGYQTLEGSSCIDAGTGWPDAVLSDFWGNPLLPDAVPDIGVSEVQPR